jgi:hypothetical protein
VRSVVTADLHMIERFRADRPEITGDSEHACEQLLDIVDATGAKQLLLLGDIFDSPTPEPASVARWLRFCSSLEQREVIVRYLLGQHDRTSKRGPGGLSPSLSWPALHGHATSAHESLFPLGGLLAYGMNWSPPDRLAFDLLKAPLTATALVCHQAWGELLPPQARKDGLLAEVERPGVVFTGDNHSHRCLYVERRDKPTLTVFSPGPPGGRNLQEAATRKAVYLVDGLEVTSLPVTSRPCFRFFCQSQEDLHTALQAVLDFRPPGRLPAAVQVPLAAFELGHSLAGEVAGLRTELKGKAHLFIRTVRVEAKTCAPRPAERPERAPVAGLLARSLERRCGPDKELYAFTLRFLLAPDAEEERRVFMADITNAG